MPLAISFDDELIVAAGFVLALFSFPTAVNWKSMVNFFDADNDASVDYRDRLFAKSHPEAPHRCQSS